MLVKEDTSPENRIYRAILSQELETLVKYYKNAAAVAKGAMQPAQEL